MFSSTNSEPRLYAAISSENHAPAAFSPMEKPRYVLNKSVDRSKSLSATLRQKRKMCSCLESKYSSSVA